MKFLVLLFAFLALAVSGGLAGVIRPDDFPWTLEETNEVPEVETNNSNPWHIHG